MWRLNLYVDDEIASYREFNTEQEAIDERTIIMDSPFSRNMDLRVEEV